MESMIKANIIVKKFKIQDINSRQKKIAQFLAVYGYYKAIELNNMKITFFKSLIPERYTTQYLMCLFSVFNYPEIQLFNHTKRENLLRLLDNVNSEITENNTDSSEEESCSSSESSTSEHETESAEVNQDRRKNSIKQLITILDDPRLKNEDIESAIIYLNKIIECKDFLNPNPNRNSAGSEKRIQPFTEKLFKKLARQVTLE
ncbi:Hypothetical_protein [Hexamita inflata]|uniref:Hypothetical_protein n=1 Tax=Hexamita inflata TaxID=28002 RepID=A0AA86TWJ3_9EUKA|nr:Hypothetical protein HINF_LOCUS17387 [Hexamita inflata]